MPYKTSQIFLTISEMAALSGVSYRTLRFYEERGLLQPDRVGLARLYSPKDRIRLELIIKAKRLGFSLSEITHVINQAVAASPEPPEDLISRLTKDELIRRIDQLSTQRKGVQAAIDGLTAALAAKNSGESS